MDPEERAWARFFPFSECHAIKEPRPGIFVSRFAGDVVIFPWIRGREPFSNITPQLVTCQTNSVLHAAMQKLCDNGRFDLFMSLVIWSSAKSNTERARCLQQNAPGTFETGSVDGLESKEKGV